MNRITLIFLIVFFTASCKRERPEVKTETDQKISAACYPDEPGKIFVTKCAISGCHNTASKDAAGGLDMSTWENLFKGARGGSAVIPYSSEHSFLVNFINTFSDLGLMQQPVMPFNGTPLTREEVLTVINWIKDGAPDCNGKRLTDNPDRKKFYITNQGCDLISVWDAEKKIIMRYKTVGASPVIEAPHQVKISPDGQYWYISFIANGARKFQRYKTSDDSFAGEADITPGSWNTFAFSPDSKYAYIIDFSNQGRVAIVDCNTMKLSTGISTNPFNPDPGSFTSPHGSAVSPDGNFLYITMQFEDRLYKLNLQTYDGRYIPLNGSSTSQPHEIAFSPDGNYYFVTCEGTNEVKILSASGDTIVKSIPVGADPVEMAFSLSKKYLLVTSMAGNSVSLINYQNLNLVKTIATGYMPHGIAVDDARGIAYIANRNLASSGGPPPHHASACGGRNGYLQAIDLNTLSVIPSFQSELSIDPYSVEIRK